MSERSRATHSCIKGELTKWRWEMGPEMAKMEPGLAITQYRNAKRDPHGRHRKYFSDEASLETSLPEHQLSVAPSV